MRLGWRDKLLIVNTILFIGIGLVMVMRCVELRPPLMSYAVAAAFLGHGAHRSRVILSALHGQWSSR
jgi:hypothetical protein